MNNANPRNVLQGYVVNIEFGGLRVPATMQNLMLRDYAAKNNFQFKLSVGEYSFPGCYLQLEGLLPLLPQLEGIGMCSMFMLPKSEERRARIYSACIEAGAALHLVLEGAVIRKASDTERVEESIKFNRWIARSPQSLERDWLPSLKVNDSFT